jgi:hypothetical protein
MLEVLDVMKTEIRFFSSNSDSPIPFPCHLVVETWISDHLICVQEGIVAVVAILSNCKHFRDVPQNILQFSMDLHTCAIEGFHPFGEADPL